MYECTTYVTAADGSEASIVGTRTAVEAVEAALKASKLAYWNAGVETWDFGFYAPVPLGLRAAANAPEE